MLKKACELAKFNALNGGNKMSRKKDRKRKNFTIFLANGKTLHFTNVSKKEDLIDEKGYPYLVLHYFDKRINKQRIAYFEMINGNVIGYAEDK